MIGSPTILAVLTAIGYYVGAKLGLALTLYPYPISVLWPPNAILLAALLITSSRHWWLILLMVLPAHLAVELEAGIPLGMVLGWFVSNGSEALIGAYCLRRITPAPLRFDSFVQVGAFVLCVGFIAPFLSSFLDAAFVILNRWGTSEYWHVWQMRFFSNVLANLTLIPVTVIAATMGTSVWRRARQWRRLEACLLFVLLVAVCWAAFMVERSSPDVSPVVLYAPLPMLLWAAVRFGPTGISASLATFALLAIWGASRGLGPFVTNAPPENALSIQLFLIVMSIPLLTVAGVMEERRTAATLVRDSEERLNLALSVTQLGTWDWEFRKDWADWSHEMTKIFGVAATERTVTMERLEQLLHVDDCAHVVQLLRETSDTEHVLEAEFRIVRPDGTLRWVFGKGKRVTDDAGTPIRITGVAVDITERKRAEIEAQNHRRELAHLGRVALVGELSGTLAHELNQPLAAILANARAGQRFLAQDPPDLGQVDEILGAIVDDDRRAGNVIRRLRALLKKDDGPREMLNLNDIIHEVVGIAHGDLIAREISVATALGHALPAVHGDRVQLQQVMLNLVLNACDALQGTTSGVRRLTLASGSDHADVVHVTVSDTGTGVRPDSLERIFEPFVTSKAQGLGLGLAICRSIVEAHDGRLWVENNPEQGATFHLVLPVSPPDALAEDRHPAALRVPVPD